MAKLNVLMTGAGAPGAPGVIRCLSQSSDLQLFVGDANENATGRHLHPHFIKLPNAGDQHFEDKILAICQAKGIQVVFPLVTRELERLSKVKKAWGQLGITILVSDIEGLTIANDKGKLYQLLKENNIAYPEFVVASNFSALREAIFKMGYPNRKVVVKPSVSNGMRGFRIVSPPQDEFGLFFSEKAGSPYISLEKLTDILSAGKIPDMVACEFLPGKEYTVDCLVNNGEVVLIVPRLRSKMTVGISTEGEIVNNPIIIEYCRKILSVLKLHGNIGIQVKEAHDGSIKLLEINPRIQGTTVALTGAGINMALLAVKLAQGIAPAPEELHVNWGVRFSRYWQEIYY